MSVKNIFAICIRPDGECVLEQIPLYYDIVSLEPGYNLFNCKLCGKCCSGRRSQSFIPKYVLHVYDPHERYDMCNLKKNIYADMLLSCEFDEEEIIYRGNMYVIKHKKRDDIEHKFTHEEILKYDTTIDCNEADIELVEKELTDIMIHYSDRIQHRYRNNYCILL